MKIANPENQVERWSVFEISLEGPADGNPFVEQNVKGTFSSSDETYLNPDGILWWSHGGELHGTSPKRIAFMARIMQETPGCGMEQFSHFWDALCSRAASTESPRKDYFIFYFGFMRPSFREFYFDDETQYEVEVIDTWNMTIKNIGTRKGKFTVELPGKEYMAIRMKKAEK